MGSGNAHRQRCRTANRPLVSSFNSQQHVFALLPTSAKYEPSPDRSEDDNKINTPNTDDGEVVYLPLTRDESGMSKQPAPTECINFTHDEQGKSCITSPVLTVKGQGTYYYKSTAVTVKPLSNNRSFKKKLKQYRDQHGSVLIKTKTQLPNQVTFVDMSAAAPKLGYQSRPKKSVQTSQAQFYKRKSRDVIQSSVFDEDQLQDVIFKQEDASQPAGGGSGSGQDVHLTQLAKLKYIH